MVGKEVEKLAFELIDLMYTGIFERKRAGVDDDRMKGLIACA